MQQVQESEYHFRTAKVTDIPALVKLIHNHAVADKDKIVIVPSMFQKQVLQSAIEKERLFVATHKKDEQEEIVGMQKMYIPDDHECAQICQEEIRCTQQSCAAGQLSLTFNTQQQIPAKRFDGNSKDLYIYRGGDFTHPDHRRKGVNTQLTQHAFTILANTTKQKLASGNKESINLLCGLVVDNAGVPTDVFGGRSTQVATAFAQFLQDLNVPLNTLDGHRYDAFMPTFDLDSAELKPLPDEKSIPGFGCVFHYPLPQTAGE